MGERELFFRSEYGYALSLMNAKHYICLKLFTFKIRVFLHGNDMHIWCELGAGGLSTCRESSDRVCPSLSVAYLAFLDVPYDAMKA